LLTALQRAANSVRLLSSVCLISTVMLCLDSALMTFTLVMTNCRNDVGCKS